MFAVAKQYVGFYTRYRIRPKNNDNLDVYIIV